MDIDLHTRNRIIAHDCSPRERADLRQHIEDMTEYQLAELSRRFGLPEYEDWREYVDGVSYESWSEFVSAYERITGRRY